MISNCVKAISNIHNYRVTGQYWSRIGMLHKRYGEETLLKAITDIPSQNIPLINLLNIIEKKCQFILENGEISELDKELLGF